VSFGADDMVVPVEKAEILAEAEAEVKNSRSSTPPA
jgi:DNA-directed RNA polymerase subunit beta'